MKVRMNRARSKAIPIASAYSRNVDLLFLLASNAKDSSLVLFQDIDPSSQSRPLHFQRGQECLLGNLHFADLLHSLLPLFLFLEQLALARDITTVALGGHVLS